MSTENLETQLASLASRLQPMLEQVRRDYRGRVPNGYPTISRDSSRGNYGIQLEPNYALFLASDGERLFTEFTYRSPRNDTRSSASREKFAGRLVFDRRPVEHELTDQDLRNLVAELLARYNMQPGLIHITDD